jgi:putative protease
MSELLEKNVDKHAKLCAEKDIDAFILGDIGLILKVKQMGLDVPFHASTYLSSMNYEAVDFLRKLGAQRVILERQVAIDEITQIVKNSSGVEIEVFVHGSGCSNINVSCYGCYTPESLIRAIPNKLSTGDFESYQNYGFTTPLNKFKMITAPFCRLTYEVQGNTGQKTYAPILDSYSFCSLCKLPMLVKTGVAGFKIVDRCQSKEYQETCTRVYRELTTILEQGQIELYNKKMVSIIKDSKALLFPNFPEVCEQKRCYYAPFFHAPYRMPIS